MLSIIAAGSILFVVELMFLIIITASLDMGKPINATDVLGTLVKFYILNIVFVAILIYFPS